MNPNRPKVIIFDESNLHSKLKEVNFSKEDRVWNVSVKNFLEFGFELDNIMKRMQLQMNQNVEEKHMEKDLIEIEKLVVEAEELIENIRIRDEIVKVPYDCPIKKSALEMYRNCMMNIFERIRDFYINVKDNKNKQEEGNKNSKVWQVALKNYYIFACELDNLMKKLQLRVKLLKKLCDNRENVLKDQINNLVKEIDQDIFDAEEIIERINWTDADLKSNLQPEDKNSTLNLYHKYVKSIFERMKQIYSSLSIILKTSQQNKSNYKEGLQFQIARVKGTTLDSNKSSDEDPKAVLSITSGIASVKSGAFVSEIKDILYGMV